MTYDEALAKAKKVGASKAENEPLLAITIATLALAHAINPRLAYDGAVKRRLTAAQVRKLDGLALGDLMFA
jgi:hypothetical protein